MNDIQKKSTEKELFINIGENKVAFRPESKKSIDLEILLLNVPLFAVIVLFSLDYLNWPLFMLFFYAVAMRIFIGNHDRYHADQRTRLPRFFEIISENLAVVVTPWDEPYNSIRKKHLRHHATHSQGKSSILDTKNDPHSVFEHGGVIRVFFSCLFYEEIQLFLDFRDGNLSKSRLYRFLLYFPLQIAFIVFFGWAKFLIVLLAMRIVGFTAWFVFSWVIHQSFIYKFGFAKQVPKLFKWVFAIIHGRRVTEGCWHHATHHAWPGIPYNQLDKFDSIVIQNPDLAPEMKPIGY